MRVAILVKEFPPDVIAGTETQTLRMARELQAADHDVTVYTKAYPGDESLDPDFDLVRVPNWQRSPFVSTVTFVLAATLYLLRDRGQYDVLQCMMIYPTGFVGYVVNRFAGIPYFAWIRGGDYYFMKDHPIKRHMIARVLADTLVLVQTEGIERDVREEFPTANLGVLGNGVDIPDRTAVGDQIVYVGRLAEQKGVDVLLHAMADLDESLCVVGDGPERDHLESLAASLGVDAEFTGELPPDRVVDRLLDGSVFVLPSVRGEGLPNAMLEAMAAGLPVVATELAGIPDVIEDGETGFVVGPGEVEALREQVRRLRDDDELRERLGGNARRYVEQNHGWGRIVEALEETYATVAR